MCMYTCICKYRHGQDVMTMSDMAYNNNAVHLTIDAYISKNIEHENNNENNNENENDGSNMNEGDSNRVENISNSINDDDSETTNSNSEDEDEEEDEDNRILSFSNQRKSSYDNWNSAPHTPYEQVSTKDGSK